MPISASTQPPQIIPDQKRNISPFGKIIENEPKEDIKYNINGISDKKVAGAYIQNINNPNTHLQSLSDRVPKQAWLVIMIMILVFGTIWFLQYRNKAHK